MKKFGFFFLLFLGGLFILDRGTAWLLDQMYVRIRTGQRGGLVNTYLSLPSRPLLLMGDSRVVVNICPDSLGPDAFSLAHHGTTQIFHTGLLSVLRQQHKLPKTIVLHVDLEEFLRPSHPEDIHYLKYYYGRAPLVTAYTNEWEWLSPLRFSFALARHTGNLGSLAKNYVSRHQPSPLNQGYDPAMATPEDSTRVLYSLQKLNAEPLYLNRAHLRYLQDFIAICRQEKVKLICFTATYYQRPRHVASTSALVDSLLRAESIPYINYAQDPITELSTKVRYWRDVTHLNILGVPLQSQYLARRLNELQVQRTMTIQ